MTSIVCSENYLRELVSSSFSIIEVLEKLGRTTGPRNKTHISKLINHFNIDKTHFVYRKPASGGRRKSWQESLVFDDTRCPTNAAILRRAMIEAGFQYQCSICDIIDTWNCKPIIIEIDHINGNRLDNRKENLRFLCPNCHSQTVNFKTKNRTFLKRSNKDKPKPIFLVRERKSLIKWPTDDELLTMISSTPITVLAKKLCVSDSAIAKYCRKRNIKTRPRGYWSKIKSIQAN